jgi:hypothetical protein
MEQPQKQITITKVVSRNFIVDWITTFQNMIGRNLTGYEKMVDRAMKQIREEIAKQKIKLAWYHYQITQMSNGAISITLYGDAS